MTRGSDMYSAQPPETRESPDERVSGLRHYVGIARRRRVPILITLAVPVALAVAISEVQPRIYEGQAEVVVARQNLANALTGTPDPTNQANDFLRIVQTQAVVARSPEVASRVIAAIRPTGLTAQELLDHSTVQPKRDADVLDFKVQDSNPALAKRLTTAYAEQFTEFRQQLDTSSLERARREVSARLAQLEPKDPRTSQLVSSLASKEQELRTLEALQTSNATVIRRATQATLASPNKKRNVMFGLLAGALLAAAVAGILEALDTRVRSAEDLERRLKLPLMGWVSPPPERLDGELLMLREPRAPEAEAFRLLRTNLEFATLGRDTKSIMVTSSVEREGKSTTISNLAVTLARAGSDVILLDLDLRQPSLHVLFGLPPGPGLTDVALARASLDNALYEIDLTQPAIRSKERPINGRLRVIRSGPLPLDPGEFVTSPFVHDTVRELRAQADFLLVDAPPVMRTSDPMGLSQVIDAIFVIARLPDLRRQTADELHRTLASSRATLLGFIVTGEGAIQPYDYGYGYGYGYGPGTEELALETPADDVGEEPERVGR